MKIELIAFEKLPGHRAIMKMIAGWRNDERIKPHLRNIYDTPVFSGQEEWLDKVIVDSTCMYYFIFNPGVRDFEYKHDEFGQLIGYCGFDKINLANRTAEISLLISPSFHRQGAGRQTVEQLFYIAFKKFNINLIHAETYFNVDFWVKQGFEKEAALRMRKYFDNKYHSSTILSMTREQYYIGIENNVKLNR